MTGIAGAAVCATLLFGLKWRWVPLPIGIGPLPFLPIPIAALTVLPEVLTFPLQVFDR